MSICFEKIAGNRQRRRCKDKSELVGALPYLSLWHIQQSPGTVKTVPYNSFYIALPAYKLSVGRDALIPPRRNIADCGKRELVGVKLRHFAGAKPFCHSNTPPGYLLLTQTRIFKEIYDMKKGCLVVLPALTIVLELLPLGAVCIFATSPTERVKETFSYFSLTPFGYANFAPLITATLTVAIFLLSLFSLKKNSVLKALFVLSIITAAISLLPLMYGLNYYTLVGALITVTLVIESILAKVQQK